MYNNNFAGSYLVNEGLTWKLHERHHDLSPESSCAEEIF